MSLELSQIVFKPENSHILPNSVSRCALQLLIIWNKTGCTEPPFLLCSGRTYMHRDYKRTCDILCTGPCTKSLGKQGLG